jgi:hypothetical protein
MLQHVWYGCISAYQLCGNSFSPLRIEHSGNNADDNKVAIQDLYRAAQLENDWHVLMPLALWQTEFGSFRFMVQVQGPNEIGSLPTPVLSSAHRVFNQPLASSLTGLLEISPPFEDLW